MDKWLAPAFSNLTTEYSDCRVIVGAKIFQCHKVILASASEFFKGNFREGSDFAESVSGNVYLQDVEPDIFDKFRKYVYTYNILTLKGYDNDTLIKLYECGSQWLVPSIINDCMNLLTERAQTMTVEEIIKLYEVAHDFENQPFIQELTVILTKNHPRQLLCDRVLLLGSDVFVQYITKVAKIKSEIERYKIIEKYVEINGFLENIQPKESSESDTKLAVNDIELNNNNIPNFNTASNQKKSMNNEIELKVKPQMQGNEKLKADYVKSLLKTIDYKKMSGSEFYLGPGKSEMLTYQAKYEIMYSILKQNNKFVSQSPSQFNSGSWNPIFLKK